jgi:large subunit ribosomal protein L11
LNVGEVVGAINEKTADFAGMKVPVKVIIDTEDKSYDIKIGSPPVSALIKKELGIEKGTGDGSPVADLNFEQLMKITNMKRDNLIANSLKGAVKEIVGACQSVGVTIEGLSPKEFTERLNSGEFDEKLKS